jgi:hypothetical protein
MPARWADLAVRAKAKMHMKKAPEGAAFHQTGGLSAPTAYRTAIHVDEV